MTRSCTSSGISKLIGERFLLPKDAAAAVSDAEASDVLVASATRGNLNGPKYPEDGVDSVLKTYFGTARLKDARTNVLVTAYAIEKRCPFFFRNWQAQAPETTRTHDFEVWPEAAPKASVGSIAQRDQVT